MEYRLFDYNGIKCTAAELAAFKQAAAMDAIAAALREIAFELKMQNKDDLEG